MLLIDDREESGAKTLAEHPLLSPHSIVCRLDSGDVAFTGNGPDGDLTQGIELKSIGNLMGSMDTAQLQGQDGQLQRMLRTYDVCWLLYYGDVKATHIDDKFPRLTVRRGKQWSTGKRPYAYLMSFLCGLNDVGIRTVHVYDKESAIAWILACYNRYSKPWEDHKMFNTLQQPIEAKKKSADMIQSLLDEQREEGLGIEGKQIMRTMASFPNISYDRARKIARHFRSILAVMIATEDDWKGIGAGIGKGIIRQTIEIIRRERR